MTDFALGAAGSFALAVRADTRRASALGVLSTRPAHAAAPVGTTLRPSAAGSAARVPKAHLAGRAAGRPALGVHADAASSLADMVGPARAAARTASVVAADLARA